MFFKLSNVIHTVAVELENYNENNKFYRKDRLSRSCKRAAGNRRFFVIIWFCNFFMINHVFFKYAVFLVFVVILLFVKPILIGFLICNKKSSHRLVCMGALSSYKMTYPYVYSEMIFLSTKVTGYLQLYNLFGFMTIYLIVAFSVHLELQ